MNKFGITSNDGFHIKLNNGWTFSCQWHTLAYCDDGKTTCEIAAWDVNGEWFTFPNGQNVLGWVTPDELIDWMIQIRDLPQVDEIKNPSH